MTDPEQLLLLYVARWIKAQDEEAARMLGKTSTAASEINDLIEPGLARP